MPTSLSENELMVANQKKISQLSRRRFFGYASAAAGLMVAASACNKEQTPNLSNTSEGVDLGSGDFGILNYAYALEQLEAAFYTKVIMSQYSGITQNETAKIGRASCRERV